MTREQQLAATFVDLARSLDGEFDVLDFLQDVVTRTSEMFDGPTATLMMSDQRGALQLAASTDPSNDVVRLLTSPGPHTDSATSGAALVNVSIATDGRWPAFAAAASGQGFVSLDLIPIHVRTELLGTFTLLFRHPVVLDQTDLTILEALAAIAKLGLLQDRTPRQQELLAEQLQSALNLRAAVEQAKGVVAERGGVAVAEAFVWINGYARRKGRPLGAVALDILEGRIGMEALVDG